MSRRYDSYVTDLPRGSGGMFKWAVLSAGVGIAFGAGMVLGQGGARDAARATLAPVETELKAASASKQKLQEVREHAFRFQFHKELQGQKPHPAALAAATAPAAPAAVALPTSTSSKPAPQMPNIGLQKAAPEKTVAAAPKAHAPVREERVARAPSADAFEANHSATENKDEHKSNMTNLRQALLRVLGDDAPVWDAGMTPPPLSTVKKAAAVDSSGGVADHVIADKPVAKTATQKPAQKNESKLLPRMPSSKGADVKVAKASVKPIVASQKTAAASFAVQVASVTSQEAADRVAAELSAQGFRAQIAKAVVNGTQVFRVRVPGFSSREAASEVKSKLGKGFVTAN